MKFKRLLVVIAIVIVWSLAAQYVGIPMIIQCSVSGAVGIIASCGSQT